MARQYHEPPQELSAEARTFARVCASLVEEAQAIGWYQERLDLESDQDARHVMEHAQKEECKHFCMDLELLMRRLPVWAQAAHTILFKPGPIGYSGMSAEAEPTKAQDPSSSLDFRRLAHRPSPADDSDTEH